MTPATIAAISSPPGGGRRGVIRLSGPDSGALVRALIEPVRERAAASGRPLDPPPLEGRDAFATRIHDGRGEQPCLVLWMPGPGSYTREDVCELHLSGNPHLLATTLDRLLALGAAPAAPGEFTRRAFLNGRMDLTQAEGVLALVDASNERERRAALALLEGGLTDRLQGLREELSELRALTEASLDFDESDTGHVPVDDLVARTDRVGVALREALAWEVRRQPPSALPRVVLVGRPNAGKSTLFNALVPGGRALVSDVAGSTRDGASGLLSVPGPSGSAVDVLLFDAPGLDADAAGADAAAQEIAAAQRANADLLVELVDAAGDEEATPGRAAVVAWSRVDRPGARQAPNGAVPIAAMRGDGLEELRAAIARALGLGDRPEAGPDTPGLVRELSARHRAALEAASEGLAAARGLLLEGAPLDLAADALRDTLDSLDGITGHTTPEDLLDRIFARFCLGK